MLYTPYIFYKKGCLDKDEVNKIMFDYYIVNCGENEVKSNCKFIFEIKEETSNVELKDEDINIIPCAYLHNYEEKYRFKTSIYYVIRHNVFIFCTSISKYKRRDCLFKSK